MTDKSLEHSEGPSVRLVPRISPEDVLFQPPSVTSGPRSAIPDFSGGDFISRCSNEAQIIYKEIKGASADVSSAAAQEGYLASGRGDLKSYAAAGIELYIQGSSVRTCEIRSKIAALANDCERGILEIEFARFEEKRNAFLGLLNRNGGKAGMWTSALSSAKARIPSFESLCFAERHAVVCAIIDYFIFKNMPEAPFGPGKHNARPAIPQKLQEMDMENALSGLPKIIRHKLGMEGGLPMPKTLGQQAATPRGAEAARKPAL